MATCQICAREIKANTGRIAHHGYRRPYEGMQTASCYGAKGLPYEQSCDLIGAYILILEGVKGARLKEIERLAAADATFLVRDRRHFARTGRTQMIEVGPAEPLYAVKKRDRVSSLEADVRAIDLEVSHHNARIKAWRPA